MGNAIGVGAITETTDGWIVLMKRWIKKLLFSLAFIAKIFFKGRVDRRARR